MKEKININFTNAKMEQEIGIYIHWPFCLSKCPYCDFNSHVLDNIDQEKWIEAYRNEIYDISEILKNKKIVSIFFGGGTPSLMPLKILEAILDNLSKIANISKCTEITLEANPTSSEYEKFKSFKKLGINRLSIGIQSFDEQSLKDLGRTHNSYSAIKAIEYANSIFENFSFDLIYARHNQTLKSWKEELDIALSFDSKHLSLYQLTIEKGTEFYKLNKEGKLNLPSDDLASEMYFYTNERLANKNMQRYEISNYALEGMECKHNMLYWKYNNFIGIGAGAHSRLKLGDSVYSIMRYHNPQKWLKSALEQNSIQKITEISSKEFIEEIIMMGLRIKDGISKKRFHSLTDKNFEETVNNDFLNEILENKLLIDNGKNYYLSDEGMNLHNYILTRLV